MPGMPSYLTEIMRRERERKRREQEALMLGDDALDGGLMLDEEEPAEDPDGLISLDGPDPVRDSLLTPTQAPHLKQDPRGMGSPQSPPALFDSPYSGESLPPAQQTPPAWPPQPSPEEQARVSRAILESRGATKLGDLQRQAGAEAYGLRSPEISRLVASQKVGGSYQLHGGSAAPLPDLTDLNRRNREASRLPSWGASSPQASAIAPQAAPPPPTARSANGVWSPWMNSNPMPVPAAPAAPVPFEDTGILEMADAGAPSAMPFRSQYLPMPTPPPAPPPPPQGRMMGNPNSGVGWIPEPVPAEQRFSPIIRGLGQTAPEPEFPRGAYPYSEGLMGAPRPGAPAPTPIEFTPEDIASVFDTEPLFEGQGPTGTADVGGGDLPLFDVPLEEREAIGKGLLPGEMQTDDTGASKTLWGLPQPEEPKEVTVAKIRAAADEAKRKADEKSRSASTPKDESAAFSALGSLNKEWADALDIDPEGSATKFGQMLRQASFLKGRGHDPVGAFGLPKFDSGGEFDDWYFETFGVNLDKDNYEAAVAAGVIPE